MLKICKYIFKGHKNTALNLIWLCVNMSKFFNCYSSVVCRNIITNNFFSIYHFALVNYTINILGKPITRVAVGMK